LNFYSGEPETTAKIVFVFPFAPIAKEKNLCFDDFQKKGRNIEIFITAVRREKYVRFAITHCIIVRYLKPLYEKHPCSKVKGVVNLK